MICSQGDEPMEDQRKSVRKMQDYIKEHIQEDIRIEDLARISAYSPWYIRRLFIKYLSMTPAVYIRRLKLSESALRLRDDKTTVLDVAMNLGFGSVDGYQRAFRKEFGCNPKEYSASPVPVWLFTPYLVENKERKVSKMSEIRQAEKKYNPEFIGYEWDDSNPRIQLEPVGKRGYIELVPVKEIIH